MSYTLSGRVNMVMDMFLEKCIKSYVVYSGSKEEITGKSEVYWINRA